jgi:hypothetical protein
MNNNIKELALQNLKDFNKTPELVLNMLSDEQTTILGNFTYKVTGVCRYYKLFVKKNNYPDTEYVELQSWND